MISETVRFLATHLDNHLSSIFPSDSARVVATAVVTADGSVPVQAVDRLAVTLVDVQQQDVMRSRTGSVSAPDFRGVTPLDLQLDVLISANFAEDRYTEALALLSAAIDYFHTHPDFSPRSTPDMPQGLSRLTIEMVNLDLVEAQAMWRTLSGRYLPSALYKVRFVVTEDRQANDVPVVAVTV